MWLLDVHTLELEYFNFNSEKLPQYAILSHRWAADPEDEVSFQEMSRKSKAARSTKPVAVAKKGFAKIQQFSIRAIDDGYYYVWIDTCCINKESSAELQEAINSMYRWYEASARCYAFLADVSADAGNKDFEQKLRESEWYALVKSPSCQCSGMLSGSVVAGLFKNSLPLRMSSSSIKIGMNLVQRGR